MSIRPDIPVILCTGFSELVSREHAEKLGLRSFLMKPIRKAELAHTVHRVLHGGKAPHA
jgi:FixJ family two-component response regulator